MKKLVLWATQYADGIWRCNYSNIPNVITYSQPRPKFGFGATRSAAIADWHNKFKQFTGKLPDDVLYRS